MNGTVAPSSRSCTVAATCRGCTLNSVAMRWTILSATVSVMGVCVSLLAHQGLFVPRISQKPREHVCQVGEAGHFAINAGGLRRAVIEFRDRRSCLHYLVRLLVYHAGYLVCRLLLEKKKNDCLN